MAFDTRIWRGRLVSVSERGIALTEAAVVIPCLLFLIFGTYDLGRMYFTASALDTVAYEGARYGSSMLDLEKQKTISDFASTAVLPAASKHTLVHLRLRRLLEENGLIPDRYYRIVTELSGEGRDARVSVEVRVPFHPLLLRAFRTITVQSEVPYLYGQTTAS